MELRINRVRINRARPVNRFWQRIKSDGMLYISRLKFLYALLFNSCSSSSSLRFTSFFASIDVTMDTMMKSNTSQTVMTDAPSNRPRKPPTCENGNTLYSYMYGKCQLLIPSTQVAFNSSYCLHCFSDLRVCRSKIENIKWQIRRDITRIIL